MSGVVVVLLGALWASILLPGVLRDRRSSHGFGSVYEFERSMQLLATRPPSAVQKRPGRHVMVLDLPDRRAQAGTRRPDALHRRQQVLRGLAVAAVAMTALAASVGGVLWALAGLTVVALGAYVAVASRVQYREALRGKVRRLPTRPSAPAYDLRNTRRPA